MVILESDGSITQKKCAHMCAYAHLYKFSLWTILEVYALAKDHS